LVFSYKDFLDIGSRGAVRLELFRLVKNGKIRRVMRGIYDYPKFSEMLGQWLSPDLNQVAQALARKFGWRIQPSGDTALNLLGLSTQVPGKIVYLSDGPHRKYSIGKLQLIFEKTVLKHASFKYQQSAWIVQALNALKQGRVNEKIIEQIRSQFDASMRKKILLDTRRVTGWIYDCIRVICAEKKDE
jgi:hypothetical protein